MHLPLALLAVLCASPSASTEAFNGAQSNLVAFRPRGGGRGAGSSSSSSTAIKSATAVVAEVPTSPIAGMRPGTSGLRKKVEVWQGIDEENKHYVENFIQSLIDTAAASEMGKGKTLDT